MGFNQGPGHTKFSEDMLNFDSDGEDDETSGFISNSAASRGNSSSYRQSSNTSNALKVGN